MPWHNSIKVVVTFATSGSEVACFELDPSQTAQDIQQELYRITGAPGYRQRLLFENEVLEPQRRLQDLGFARELSLLLIVQDVFQPLALSEESAFPSSMRLRTPGETMNNVLKTIENH